MSGIRSFILGSRDMLRRIRFKKNRFVRPRFFRNKLKAARSEFRAPSLRLHVRRNQVFMDSFHQLRMRTADEMKGKLTIVFQGEEGMDAGGRKKHSRIPGQFFLPHRVFSPPQVRKFE